MKGKREISGHFKRKRIITVIFPGKLSRKRMTDMLKRLCPDDLGVYKSTFRRGGEKTVQLKPISFAELQLGENPDVVIYGAVVGVVPNAQTVP